MSRGGEKTLSLFLIPLSFDHTLSLLICETKREVNGLFSPFLCRLAVPSTDGINALYVHRNKRESLPYNGVNSHPSFVHRKLFRCHIHEVILAVFTTEE